MGELVQNAFIFLQRYLDDLKKLIYECEENPEEMLGTPEKMDMFLSIKDSLKSNVSKKLDSINADVQSTIEHMDNVLNEYNNTNVGGKRLIKRRKSRKVRRK